ncbi:FAS1 domain-containing protein [Aspergillus karnatakaensis]|uniref:fasciclin domain-containing protein n=1 Tax=Aspergillus karnatakaensis TaxID=1810916 RepID=UPI003CCDBBBF
MKLQLLAVAAPVCSALAIQDVLSEIKDQNPLDSALDSALESSPAFSPTDLTDFNFNFNLNLDIDTWIKDIFNFAANEITNPPSDLVDDLAATHPIHSDKTIYQLISESKYTTILAKIIDSDQEWIDYLNTTDRKLTFFAPTDDAFRKIPHRHHDHDGDHDDNGDHGDHEHHHIPKEIVRAILQYHSSPDVLKAIQLFHSHTIPTALEDPLLGSTTGDNETGLPQRLAVRSGFRGLTLNFYSHIVAADIGASNGLIHGISSILLPPPRTLLLLDVLPTKFSTFNLALHKASLTHYLNTTSTDNSKGFTLFAPSNRAFEHLGLKINAFLFSPPGLKYLAALLKYHIVPGTTVYSDTVYTKDGEIKPLSLDGDVIAEGGLTHLDLETLLGEHKISVDVAHFGPYVSFKLNGWQTVGFADALARDGVVHVLEHILLPPRRVEGEEGELTVEGLVERLGPWVEDGEIEVVEGVEFEEIGVHGWDL